MDDQFLSSMRESYKGMVGERDKMVIADWKVVERAHFLSMLPKQAKLLEIGAGAGKDSLFFQENGLTVTCTDLSPEMVELCRSKGLNAQVMDFDHLDFPEASFDAIYALNCLLHVPKPNLPPILQRIRRILKPGGFFFMGVYGGYDFEGILPSDDYVPKRFFSFYSDDHIQRVVSAVFEIVYFKPVIYKEGTESNFQSMILKPQHS